MATESARDVIRFAEKALLLLDEGGFTATYKFAVLLGLMDLCLEASARDGSPPEMVTTRQLAEKVIELYWPQTTQFDGRVLRQNRRGQAEIVSLIEGFRAHREADPSAPLYRARSAAPDAYARLVEEVEWKLIEMPLPRLQRIGRSLDEFLYMIYWNDQIRRSEVRGDEFDNRILFQPGASAWLVDLSGLLRPLVHRKWVGLVTQLNGLPESDLEEFLFGRDRISLQPVRESLLQLQNGRCFYCGSGVILESADVDHFLPWSRHPDNGVQNLLVAHATCNRAKSDFLASADHVQHWSTRLSTHRNDLLRIARDANWENDEGRTLSVTRAIYAHLPDDARLWERGGIFVQLERAKIDVALGIAGE
jgi:hypothetical protein